MSSWADGNSPSGPSAHVCGLVDLRPREHDEGDVALDRLCGCGTTVDPAQKLGRRWIGIDITTLAVELIDARLRHTYGESIQEQYDILGIPKDIAGAEALFKLSPFEFERWCVMMLDGQPNEKQVGEKGIDGVIRFPVDNKGGSDRVLVSVKGGATNPGHVRDLVGTVQSQRRDGCLRMHERADQDDARSSEPLRYVPPPDEWTSVPDGPDHQSVRLLDDKKPNMPTAVLPYFQAQRRDEDDEPLF